MVTFHTNHGDIVIKTFDDKAPETVKNFLDYCREGFYNNTIFHRVINGFMIHGQLGSPSFDIFHRTKSIGLRLSSTTSTRAPACSWSRS